MKRSILAERRGYSIVGADPWAEEEIAKLPFGKAFTITVSEDRSLPQNNLFHAGLALAQHNLPEELDRQFPTPTHLKKAFLIALGYAEPIYRIDGSFYMEADSVAFSAMNAEDFTAMFDRAKVLAVEWLGYDCWQAWIDQKKDQDWRRNYRQGDE